MKVVEVFEQTDEVFEQTDEVLSTKEKKLELFKEYFNSRGYVVRTDVQVHLTMKSDNNSIIVAKNNLNVTKTDKAGIIIRFTNEELKWLDKNNFKLMPNYKYVLNQQIDDWFWNTEELEVD